MILFIQLFNGIDSRLTARPHSFNLSVEVKSFESFWFHWFFGILFFKSAPAAMQCSGFLSRRCTYEQLLLTVPQVKVKIMHFSLGHCVWKIVIFISYFGSHMLVLRLRPITDNCPCSLAYILLLKLFVFGFQKIISWW